ncbi:FmdB family transcriptional regulator [Pontimonas sp.]|jgi:putative FmdB family regulatory protein|nr:FmdB family zinc ribbon protein [Pontimonas sp.]MDA8887033.1 FmdB family transcriptional regulator [Pontimonas sp.]
MPTYSYRCTACDVAFDIVQDFTDESLTTCEACGGKLRKLFSAVGVTFQGSGFYRTDSRAEAKKSSSPTTEKKAAPKKESSSTPAATTT